MQTQILVVAEHDGVQLDPITSDLVSWALKLATAKNWKVGVLVAGSDVRSVADAACKLSTDAVYVLDNAALKDYNAPIYVEAMAHVLEGAAPQAVLFGHTYLGIELSGGLAARLGAVSWNNCRSIECSAGGYKVVRPMCGGSFVSTLEVEAGTCNIFSMQRGYSAAVDGARRTPELVELPAVARADNMKIKVTGETRATFAEDITKADVLVAVGRGIGQPSQLPAFRDLAQALDGVIAASRPLVDNGWLPVDHQVGLSGRTVAPKVYLACGISGSAQHMAGMRNSKVIIAINSDANAPIFQIAHYGVVADMFALLPELMEAAKAKQ